MFRQKIHQIFYWLVDLMISNTDGATDGVKISSSSFCSFVRSLLHDSDTYVRNFDFNGDKFVVCPKNLSERVSEEFFKNFPEFVNKFKNLLGDFNLDIAYQYVTVYTGSNHRQSLLWHHDSVGHRIKIFVPLYATTMEKTLFWEENTFENYKTPIYFKDRENYKPTGKIHGFGGCADEILILNTNCMHSGNSSIEMGAIRNVFVLEFSSRYKSLIKASRVGQREIV